MTGGLTEAMIYDLTRQGLWVAVVISAPVLTVALVVGVVIGLLQALTSVQEMTLTFVPKAAAIIAVFWLSMGFMTTSLVAFFTDALVPLISGG
ncbi:MAG: flagellar biosynthetic protein FliQ [Tabrizicola sp.]